MARIAGIDLPRTKRVEIGLTYIYGIGRKRSNDILTEAGVSADIRVKDLSEDDVRPERECFRPQRRRRPMGSSVVVEANSGEVKTEPPAEVVTHRPVQAARCSHHGAQYGPARGGRPPDVRWSSSSSSAREGGQAGLPRDACGRADDQHVGKHQALPGGIPL